MKTVTRTWTTKDGTVKTKTYTYDKDYNKKKETRFKSFFTKSGNIRTGKGLNKILKDFKKELLAVGYIKEEANKLILNLTDAPETTIKNTESLKKARAGRWTIGQLAASLYKNKLALMISNTGYDIVEVANYIGVSTTELLNTANWSGRVFTNPNNGDQFEVRFGVYGDGMLISNVIVKLDTVNLEAFMSNFAEEYNEEE